MRSYIDSKLAGSRPRCQTRGMRKFFVLIVAALYLAFPTMGRAEDIDLLPPTAPLTDSLSTPAPEQVPPPSSIPSVIPSVTQSPMSVPSPSANSGEIQVQENSPTAPENSPENSNALTSTSQTRARDEGALAYQLSHPHWGLEISGTLKAFGGADLTNQANPAASAFSVQADYQPEALQSIGVVGFGPAAQLYTLPAGITQNAVGVWSIGGQIRYQARFFREQPIVPTVAYSLEELTYFFNGTSGSGAQGSLLTSGITLGAWLLLNIFEPENSAEFHYNYGVSRSYLVAELRSLSGSDANLNIGGQSFYFGLRFEF